MAHQHNHPPHVFTATVLATLWIMTSTLPATVVAQSPLPFSFGTSMNDTSTPPNDDGSSRVFILPEPMLFYDEIVEQFYQNTNGDITFDLPYSAFTPQLIPSTSVPPMIAGYWTDIDTRNGGSGRNELWARVSRSLSDRTTADTIIRNSGVSNFLSTSVIVTTWNKVEAYSRRTGASNTFQIIVAYNRAETFVILAYRQLQFFATDTAQEAFIGFNDRQGLEGILSSEVNTNDTMAFLVRETNCGLAGTFVYRLTYGAVFTGCGSSAFRPFLSPFYGPIVGGTVITLAQLPVCLEDETAQVFCRFSSTSGNSVVSSGERADQAKVRCITPYSGAKATVSVQYSVHNSSLGVFEPTTALWTNVSTPFRYFDEYEGVVLTTVDGVPLLNAGEPFKATWSAWALRVSALATLVLNASSVDDLLVDAEVHALDGDSFVRIQASTLPSNDLNSTVLSLPESAIANYLLPWGPLDSTQVALVFVRLVAYTNVNGTKSTGASRSSTVIGVQPSLSARRLKGRMLQQACSMKPKEECEGFDDLPPCPGSIQVARADGRYPDDDACIFKDGGHRCDISLGLKLDFSYTCAALNYYPADALSCFRGTLDASVDLSGCGCETFHRGANGCVRRGKTQCCYRTNGVLITDPNQGAGTADCFAATGLFTLSGIKHVLHDVIPYIKCCIYEGRNSPACQEYYEQRPPISDRDYTPPPPPARAAGDPHLRTIDGLPYDFNGYGEYVAYCAVPGEAPLDVNDILSACDPGLQRLDPARSAISLHLRFAPRSEGDVGTVTVALALEDPLHREGTSAIAVVPHPTRRLDILDGSTVLEFPNTYGVLEVTSLILDSGVTIQRTADLEGNQTVRVVITTPSGVRLEVSETGGVMLPSMSIPDGLLGRSLGLFGRADGNSTNDFINRFGTLVDTTSASTPGERDETLFSSFGQTWMVRSSSGSLFQALDGSAQSFSNYYRPSYVPTFVVPVISPELQAEADRVCGSIASETIRLGCYFDIAVTRDVAVFAEVAQEAVQEEISRVQVLTNHAPNITGPAAVAVNVLAAASTTFPVVVTDADGDNLTFSLDFNDGNAFNLSNVQANQALLTFAGTLQVGNYLGTVVISDGLVPTLFSATVTIVPATTILQCIRIIRAACNCPSVNKPTLKQRQGLWACTRNVVGQACQLRGSTNSTSVWSETWVRTVANQACGTG